jgi:hypothetical protein
MCVSAADTRLKRLRLLRKRNGTGIYFPAFPGIHRL